MARMAACMALALGACASTGARADWTLLQTEHFSLYTQRDDDAVRMNLRQLEVFRWMALKLMGADERSVRAQARFDIYVLNGRLRRLFPGLGEDTRGIYASCSDGAAAYGTHGNEINRLEDWDLIVLQHEYAHHLMFQYATMSYPAWYVEGFAEYISTSVFAEGSISLGRRSFARTSELAPWQSGGYEEVLRWQSSKGNSNNDISTFYAPSWLLVHYMLSDDERAKKLNDYFVRIGAGEDPVAAFELATGIAVVDLPKRLKRHLREMAVLRLKGDDMPRPVIRAFDLGQDAADYVLATAQLTCTDRDRAQPVLAKLRALAPDPARASPGLRLTLASAEARFGDPVSAIALLDAIVAADAGSAEAHYLLGRAWTRRAEKLSGHEEAAAREQARANLFKAYRLRKDHAPTLYHLARALSPDGPSPNAVNAARAARLLAPAVPDYAVLEAQLDLQLGDRERAIRALGPLASNPHDPGAATRVRQAIGAIRAGRSVAEVESLMKPQPKTPAR
ncbi:MAG TPA: tetratricopeptide repeat protein [Albitalea sp.]|nr:tetratricopeptide repeat protein [Albitalea sp.]